MFEYNLIISGKPNFIAEDCIKNWDEISYSMKRDGFSGIVRSFSSQFEFTNEAYSMLVDEYLSKGVGASAQIEIYELSVNRGKVFLFGSSLDFGSFEYSDSVAYINAADSTLAAKIKAKKSTNFEYPVADMKEPMPLKYDRLMMKSRVEWISSGEYKDMPLGKAYVTLCMPQCVVPLYVKNSEICVSSSVEVQDNSIGTKVAESYILTNVYSSPIVFRVRANFTFYLDDSELSGDIRDQFVTFSLRLLDGNNEYTTLHKLELERGKLMVGDFIYDNDVSLPVGYKLAFVASGAGVFYQLEEDSSNQCLVVEFYLKNRFEMIDVIRPVTLLNNILKSINDGKEGFVGEIEDTDIRIANTLILPAESIRGFDNAKIYTSLRDFSSWMEAVFGYVPYVDGNKLVYKKRDSLYNSSVRKRLSDFGYDIKVKVENSNIYSAIKIGYEKQYYESVNGREEFRFGVEYDTGISITGKRLELISPYRADAYGVEFLVMKRGDDTTDSDSDKDVLFVGASSDGKVYNLDREGYSVEGVVSPAEMFNLMYSPKACLEANKGYIASFTDKLKFASSEGNSDVIINSKSEKSDETFTKEDAIFSISTLSVESAQGGMPADIHGLVEVERNGYLYTCYINEAKYKLGAYDGVTYELQIKNITKL